MNIISYIDCVMILAKFVFLVPILHEMYYLLLHSVENNVRLLNLIVNSVKHFAFLFKYEVRP